MKQRSSVWAFGLVAAIVAGAGACGTDGGGSGPGPDRVATLEVSRGGQPLVSGGLVSVSQGSLAVGEYGTVSDLRLINTGNDTLEITAISVASDPAGVFAVTDINGDPLQFPILIDSEKGPDNGNPLTVWLSIDMTRPEDGSPTGTITIRSDSVVNGVSAPELKVRLEVENNPPRLQVSPAQVDFGPVAQDVQVSKPLTLLNSGGDTLVIDSFVLRGHQAFSFAIPPQSWPVSPETSGAGIMLDEPIVIEPGQTVPVAALFKPTSSEAAEGQLVLYSNDPAAVQGTVVKLQGNVGGPCISVNPKKVDFGGKLVGRTARIEVEVTSCGDQPLSISELVLTSETSANFGLSLDGFVAGSTGTNQLGQSDPPVVLQPNQSKTFQVTYTPDQISPLGSDDRPIPDTGVLRIRSNSFQSVLDVEVRGFGVEVECPTAVIAVQEGEEVIPQTKLHLIGSQSYAATGTIDRYQWEVRQPAGSQSVFLPSATAADPTFEANVAGTYIFRLTVVDSSGTESCVPAETTVLVNPDEAIHIELLWDTPSDPNQTDEGPEAGADLDVHFLHQFATGGYDGDGDGKLDGWFDSQFDCFWHNAKPNWGSIDPTVDDDPSLDRDDTDGAGPENVNLNSPEDGKSYRVGVHYWDDHGYGRSYATLRIYIFSTQVFEVQGTELVDKDMWYVATVDWPSGAVNQVKACGRTPTPCVTDADCTGGLTCGNRIAPNYVHPLYTNPN
ncbi:MAG: choice-of-anchor D domain-containing protein [Deltaproteobacteria bacterium]|nr:choice-of-anchor D domain-containing protein [Deltaproteobacteria bacterium]